MARNASRWAWPAGTGKYRLFAVVIGIVFIVALLAGNGMLE